METALNKDAKWYASQFLNKNRRRRYKGCLHYCNKTLVCLEADSGAAMKILHWFSEYIRLLLAAQDTNSVAELSQVFIAKI